MDKLSYTFGMMRASWSVLRQDKELLFFPLVSALCCFLVILSFAIPLVVTGAARPPASGSPPAQHVVYYGILFLFYFVNYFIIIFFNSAVVACAVFRMRGGDPTVKTGLNAAMTRLPQIAGWALLSATVGMLLRMLEGNRRRNAIGRIIAGVLGMAWSVMTFLVIPVLVVEKKGPVDAVKESVRLLRKTWGEQLIGNFSFGLIFLFLSFVGIVPIIAGVMLIHQSVGIAVSLIALGALYLIGVSLVQSTLQTIFQAAVYLYARDGRAPAGFPEDQLGMAMHSGSGSSLARTPKIFGD